MSYLLEIRRYSRELRRPLHTAYGEITSRKGLIIRLTDANGKYSYGEVAPLEHFETETLDMATKLLIGFEGSITINQIRGISEHPCTQSALEMALLDHSAYKPVKSAGLLSAGEIAISQAMTLLTQGFDTFKWKIGVAPIEQELQILSQLQEALSGAQLRLDANGTLSLEETKKWLTELDKHENIDFLEQPMMEVSIMKELQQDHSTSIALDESITNYPNLRNEVESGWKGPLVIKPALLGPLVNFAKWKSSCKNILIFSSAFETKIGLSAIIALAQEHPHAHGLGTLDYFLEDGLSPPATPLIDNDLLNPQHKELIWQKTTPF